MKKLLSVSFAILSVMCLAQDKAERIKRDVEVAENVLSTLIRQQLEKRSSFWPVEVRGTYTEGYGVTLRIPYDNVPFGAFSITTDDHGPTIWAPGGEDGVTITAPRKREREELEAVEVERAAKAQQKVNKENLKNYRDTRKDSARTAYGEKLLQASKTFLADYGDLIGLEPGERIMITTKSERGGRNYSYVFAGSGDFKTPKRNVISVEAMKSDLTQYKQNKITRDQLLAKFKVVNTELTDEAQPDLELLSTIFSRLYRSDLSKTYFSEGAPYYERMKDFGVTYFMQVFSSNVGDYNKFSMPTQNMEDLDQAARDKKVIELYPLFEKDLKDNMVDYGRTLNSLKDDELLIFDVTLTKCKGCGIPSTVEFSVKASVLRDFGSGKISKDAASAKINIKKGNAQ
jgi:hypothetical protein